MTNIGSFCLVLHEDVETESVLGGARWRPRNLFGNAGFARCGKAELVGPFERERPPCCVAHAASVLQTIPLH